MKSKLLSISLLVLLVLSVVLLVKIGCNNADLQDLTSQLNTELMQSNLDLGRAETQFGNVVKYAKDLEKGIEEEIKLRNAEITRYGELVARFERLRTKRVKTKIVYRDRETIKLKNQVLTPGALYFAANNSTLKEIQGLSGKYEDNILRIDAKVIAEDLSTDGNYPFEFTYALKLRIGMKLIETHTPTGAINHYAEIYAVDTHGNKLEKLKLERFQMIVKQPDQGQWFWWAPHLDIGAIGTVKLTPPGFIPGGSLGVSFMGYGLTVNDLEWRVLRVSLDLADGQPGIGLTPGLWNMGALIPVISNLWIGPHVLYLPPESWAIGLFVGAVL